MRRRAAETPSASQKLSAAWHRSAKGKVIRNSSDTTVSIQPPSGPPSTPPARPGITLSTGHSRSTCARPAPGIARLTVKERATVAIDNI